VACGKSIGLSRYFGNGGFPVNLMQFNETVLIVHFLGLAMGMSVSFGNFVMMGLMASAAPGEKPVLARFPPAMSKVGHIGLSLLWASGLTMVYTRWNGFAGMPWQFDVKIAAVVLLTATVLYADRLQRQIRRGDMSAARIMPTIGKVASICGVTALIFAVLTFD